MKIVWLTVWPGSERAVTLYTFMVFIEMDTISTGRRFLRAWFRKCARAGASTGIFESLVQ